MSATIDKIKSEASKFVVPAKALSDVFIDTAEKMVSMQMDSCKIYSDITFTQLKKVPDIHDLGGAGDFVWGQIEPISEFNKQLLNDWKSLMALNTEFSNNLKSVFSTKMEKAADSVDSIVPAEAAQKEEKPEAVTKITKAKRTTRRATSSTSK